MSSEPVTARSLRLVTRGFLAVAMLVFFASSSLFAEDLKTDPEAYKFRVGGQFWYPTPTGSVSGTSSENSISFDRTLGFQSYSTFNAGLDWHFARKHHLFFLISPNKTTRGVVLNRTITFKGKTYEAGSSINSELRNYSFAPGYRYDIIHRQSGHLGILAQFSLLDIKATITGAAVNPDGSTTITKSSGSVFAPLPVFGPEGRAYFARKHLYVDGNIKGMYFFGYGNFISTGASVGLRLGSHIDAVGGYQMGSRLVVNGTSSRLNVRLTQRGPTVGLEFSF